MARRDPGRPAYEFTVPAAVEAVPDARRHVVALVRESALPVLDDTLHTIELLAGEVIANAVLYSKAPCDVAVVRVGARIRVEVTDTDASLPSAVEAGLDDEGGRGLLLVDTMADAWGTRLVSRGKTTWFEVVAKSVADDLDSQADGPMPSAGDSTTAARSTARQTQTTLPVNSAGVGTPYRAA